MADVDPHGSTSSGRAHEGPAGGGAFDRFCRRVLGWSHAVAVFGGLILIGIVVLTVVSVTLRGGFNAPMMGDFEIIEFAAGIAIFAMFPYCRKVRGNIRITLFVEMLPAAVQHLLEVANDVVFTVVLAVICWRMALGGIEAYHDNAQSMMIELPIWWGYIFGTLFIGVTTLLAACQIYLRLRFRDP